LRGLIERGREKGKKEDEKRGIVFKKKKFRIGEKSEERRLREEKKMETLMRAYRSSGRNRERQSGIQAREQKQGK